MGLMEQNLGSNLLAEVFGGTVPDGLASFIEMYWDMTSKWGSRINLTNNLNSEAFFQENILDPLRAYNSVSKNRPHVAFDSIMDLGCGGGYVGLLIHVAQGQTGQLILLDKDRKKINFCKQVVREAGLKRVNCIYSRIEDLDIRDMEGIDAVWTRATWNEEDLISLRRDTVLGAVPLYLLKGRENTLNNTRESWEYPAPPGKSSRFVVEIT